MKVEKYYQNACLNVYLSKKTVKTSLNKLIFFIFFALLTFLAISCQKNETEKSASTAPNQFYSYFPLKIGNTYIYRIDSEKYNPNAGKYDSSTSYLKEVIDSPFIDNTGETTFKVLRYWAKDTLKGWASIHTWTAKRNGQVAETWEENIRYVKMMFPVALSKSWNGNLYNNIDSFREYNYNYQEVNKSFAMPYYGVKYDSTTLVEEINWTDNVTETIIKKDRYAAGIGLICREDMDTVPKGYSQSDLNYFSKQYLIKFY